MEWCAKANSSAERRSEGTQRRVESCGQLGERPRVESSLLLWVPGEPLFLLPGMQGPAPRGEIRGNREGRVREGAKDGWGGRTALHSHPDDARPLTGKVRVPYLFFFTSNRVTPHGLQLARRRDCCKIRGQWGRQKIFAHAPYYWIAHAQYYLITRTTHINTA